VNPAYLLDTNVLSEPLRAAPDARVMARFRANRGAIVLCAPAIHELIFGARLLPPSRRRRAIERYVDDLLSTDTAVLPYDLAAAEWHAGERARLIRAGLTPPYIDGQIAAIAAVNRLVLVTSNVRDFQYYSGLDIEDWRM